MLSYLLVILIMTCDFLHPATCKYPPMLKMSENFDDQEKDINYSLSQWASIVNKAPEGPVGLGVVKPLISGNALRVLLERFNGVYWSYGMSSCDQNAIGGLSDYNWQQLLTRNIVQSNGVVSKSKNDDLTWFFVRRLSLPRGTKVIYFGDLHGSIHGLLRGLRSLQEDQLIDDDFYLAPGVYLVFLGDVVDRGWYGAECWYTLLRLKQENPINTIIVRGNHEEEWLCTYTNGFGPNMPSFIMELEAKYGGAWANFLFTTFKKAFRRLPIAAFIGCNGAYVQSCHGGIEDRWNPAQLLSDQRDDCVELLPVSLSQSTCMPGRLNRCQQPIGFNWADFAQGTSNQIVVDAASGRYSYTVPFVEEYLDGCNHKMLDTFGSAYAQAVRKIMLFIRGHQDCHCPYKLLFGATRYALFTPEIQAMYASCDPMKCDGPKPWDVVYRGVFEQTPLRQTYPLYMEDVHTNGVAPIITLSNATETQVPYGGYGILELQDEFKKWLFTFVPVSPLQQLVN